MDQQDLLLIRTVRPCKGVFEFADFLRRVSHGRVLLLVDNRRGNPLPVRDDLLILDDASYRSLNLHCPADVAWRCGDYGLYLARKTYPDFRYYWMLEDDLRIDGDAAEFFRFFSSLHHIDLLAARLAPAKLDWHWYPHSMARDVTTYSCFFPITRSSGRALDLMYETRRKHSRQLNRLLLWPNDESFCATSVISSGLVAEDINGLGRTFYDDEGYSLMGDSKQLSNPCIPPRLLHPVYIERDADRSSRSTQRYSGVLSRGFRVRRALAKRLNAVSKW